MKETLTATLRPWTVEADPDTDDKDQKQDTTIDPKGGDRSEVVVVPGTPR